MPRQLERALVGSCTTTMQWARQLRAELRRNLVGEQAYKRTRATLEGSSPAWHRERSGHPCTQGRVVVPYECLDRASVVKPSAADDEYNGVIVLRWRGANCTGIGELDREVVNMQRMGDDLRRPTFVRIHDKYALRRIVVVGAVLAIDAPRTLASALDIAGGKPRASLDDHAERGPLAVDRLEMRGKRAGDGSMFHALASCTLRSRLSAVFVIVGGRSFRAARQHRRKHVAIREVRAKLLRREVREVTCDLGKLLVASQDAVGART